jgi:hypothetical protein
MWPRTFEERLTSWHRLRERCQSSDVGACLLEINRWWHHSPWTPYYLHWDDRHDWPDPWQLFEDNVYCGLARALGIMYTVILLDRADLINGEIIETENDNLVLMNEGKYILNWTQDSVVNIITGSARTQRRITQQQLQQKIR